jgi:hypothetical protein
MYVVPQYFLSSAMRSVIVLQQQWIIVSAVPASALDTGTKLLHIDGAWSFELRV